MSLSQFFYRFMIGGLIVALIPFVSKQFSPRLGGMVMLIPAITIISLYLIGRDQGTTAVKEGAIGGLLGLLPLTVFLIVLAFASGNMSTLVAFGSSLATWAAMVAIVNSAKLRHYVVAVPLLIASPVIALARGPYGYVAGAGSALAGLVGCAILDETGVTPLPAAALTIAGGVAVSINFCWPAKATVTLATK